MTFFTFSEIIGAEHHPDWVPAEFVPYCFCRSVSAGEAGMSFKLFVLWRNMLRAVGGKDDPNRCYGAPRAAVTLFRRCGEGWEEIDTAYRELEPDHAFALLKIPAGEAYKEVDIETAMLLATYRRSRP